MKKGKLLPVFYFTAAICFYAASLITFIVGDDTSMGVIWLLLGSTNLCFGAVWLNKDKKGGCNDPKNK